MKVHKDSWLLLAIVIAVACPALPLPIIGNPTNIATLVLLAVLIYIGSRGSLVRLSCLLVILYVLVLISTVAGVEAANGYATTFNPNAFGPFVRIPVCFFALSCADNPIEMRRKLLWVGAAASGFAVLQYFSPIVAEFTSIHYLSSERSSVFTDDFSGASIVRVIGFYENPSSVALLCIALILTSLHLFSKQQINRSTLLLFLVLHVAAGLLSLSKIFFAGLPLILIQLTMLRYRKSAILLVVLCIAAALTLYALDDPLVAVIRYALDATLNPDIALKGRYLASQEAVVNRGWLFGYGAIAVTNVMINDSAYLVTLYLFGIFGGTIFFATLAWPLWTRRRHLPSTLYLLVTIILIAGIGTNSIIGYRVDILLTAIFSLLYIDTKSLKVKEINTV